MHATSCMRFLTSALAAALFLTPVTRAQNDDGVPGVRGQVRADAKRGQQYNKCWALVVGTNYADQPELTLKNAESDADAIAALLRTHYRFAPDSGETVVLKGDQAKGDAIRHHLGGQFLGDAAKVGKDDCVLVFFAGHGQRVFKDGKTAAVILPADVKIVGPKARPETCLRIQDDVVPLLKDCPARHKLLILDCCHSGAVFDLAADIAALPRNPADDRRAGDLFANPSLQVLVSCRSSQKASDGKVGSPFAAALQRGLKTLPNDRRYANDMTPTYITATDVFRYLHLYPDLESLGQRPDLRALEGDGEFRFLPAGNFIQFLPSDRDSKLLRVTAPGEYGNWWFEEYPWLMPSLRWKIVERGASDSRSLGDFIGAEALYKNAEAVLKDMKKEPPAGDSDQEKLGKLRRSHFELLVRTAEGGKVLPPDVARKLTGEMESENVRSLLQPEDVHYLAVLKHHLGGKDAEAARDLYVRALDRYQARASETSDASRALHALCLTDFGQYAVAVLGDNALAAQQYRSALELYPMEEAMPAPFRVFVLCRQADAWQALGAWGDANRLLARAVKAAYEMDPLHALTAHAYVRQAWARMEQWRFAAAEEAFKSARAILEKQDAKNFNVVLARSSVDHGLAMIQRFHGRAEDAAGGYRRVLDYVGNEFQQLRSRPGGGQLYTEFRPKLVERYVNSLERCAECNMFRDRDESDLAEAVDDLRRALRSVYLISGTAGQQRRAALLYKQAVVLALPSRQQDIDLAKEYCLEAVKIFETLPEGKKKAVEFHKRLALLIVELYAAEKSKTADRAVCLAKLRDEVLKLRAESRNNDSRDNLEYLLFASRVLVENRDPGDRYSTLADAELLLGFCRRALRGKQGVKPPDRVDADESTESTPTFEDDTREYLRPYYDAAVAAKLDTKPKGTKDLIEAHHEATTGQPFRKVTPEAVLALYVLDKTCYAFLDVPRGPSKVFRLSDYGEKYTFTSLARACYDDKKSGPNLPPELLADLTTVKTLTKIKIKVAWNDPRLSNDTVGNDPRPSNGTVSVDRAMSRCCPFVLPGPNAFGHIEFDAGLTVAPLKSVVPPLNPK